MENKLIPFVKPTHMPGHGGWGNGYVAIPKWHPCYGMEYDDIHNKYDIDVNGGLTFSGRYDKEWGCPDETEGMWIVGFDTLHYGDDMKKWPDEISVMAETNSLKHQLENLKPITNEQ